MLVVIMLSVVMLYVIVLSVIPRSIVILNVVAPFCWFHAIVKSADFLFALNNRFDEKFKTHQIKLLKQKLNKSNNKKLKKIK
jgi:hypothetical protein